MKSVPSFFSSLAFPLGSLASPPHTGSLGVLQGLRGLYTQTWSSLLQLASSLLEFPLLNSSHSGSSVLHSLPLQANMIAAFSLSSCSLWIRECPQWGSCINVDLTPSIFLLRIKFPTFLAFF